MQKKAAILSAVILVFLLFGTTACSSQAPISQESYDNGSVSEDISDSSEDVSNSSAGAPGEIASDETVEYNVLYLNVGGQLYKHSLQSFTEQTEWSANFVATDESGNAVSVATVLIPADASSGDEFTSEDNVDQTNGNGGVLLYDTTAGRSFSALNTSSINSENDYFGIGEMAGDNQFVIVIDYLDDNVLIGRFAAEYAHSDYGSDDALSVAESTFAIDFNNLPATQSSAGSPDDPFADDSWNDLLGEVEPGDITSGGGVSGEVCTYCNGTGIKSVCTLCGGAGFNDNEMDVLYNGAYVCPSCLGEGSIDCIHCENGIAY